MSKPEFLTGRKDGKTRRNAVKHNKEFATVIALKERISAHTTGARAVSVQSTVAVNKANGVCDHVSVPGLDEWALAE